MEITSYFVSFFLISAYEEVKKKLSEWYKPDW